jgi:pilus assembly protein Flp/PilA
MAMHSMLMRFLDDERGGTSLEYALIAVLISVFIISAVTGVATQVSTLFHKVDTTVSGAASKI